MTQTLIDTATVFLILVRMSIPFVLALAVAGIGFWIYEGPKYTVHAPLLADYAERYWTKRKATEAARTATEEFGYQFVADKIEA
ncbi:hypothetical protein [Longimicrobium sp.]|jgi:hypothetical protein|uniref:hypothetical protein n=1 Tax=Longimicrobium sp. TaxID=2029185 RepID=UPI002EDAE3AC